MGRDLRFLVFTRDEEFVRQLRALFSGIGGVRVVAEVDELALLGQAVRQFPVDVVWTDLDPTPEAVLPVVGEIAAASPGPAFFATSSSTDGQLILKVMRIGAREYFPKPVDPKTLKDAIDKVAQQRADALPQGRLITVMGAAGGVGATTIAANLAVELARLAAGKVTLVDLDYRFGQIATVLDVEPTYTLADLCNSPEQLEPSVIHRALVKHESGVSVLSRPASFAQADTITAASCVGLLTTLLQFNEYVVTDGPIRFDLSARAVMDLADANLFILQLLVPNVRNAVRMLEAMRESGANLSRVKIVCNRVEKDTANLSVDDVAGTLSLPVFASIPDDWQTVSGAVNLGESLSEYGPRSKVRMAIEELARRLHGSDEQADDKDARKKGFRLLGRIFAGAAAS
jgi:pilus assembly protein CpaE